MIRGTLYVLALVGLSILFLLMFLEAFIAVTVPIPGARDISIEANSRTLERLHAKLKHAVWGDHTCVQA